MSIIDDMGIGIPNGLNPTDKKALIDIVNIAEVNEYSIKSDIITLVNSKANTSLLANSTWLEIKNAINSIIEAQGTAQPEDVLYGKTFTTSAGFQTGTLSFSSLFSNMFNAIWNKSLGILLVDNDNNYIAANKKYDSDGNLISTSGTAVDSWDCIDNNNNIYKFSTSSNPTDKTVTIKKANSNFDQVFLKSVDLSSVLTYKMLLTNLTPDSKIIEDVVYYNNYIYVLLSAQDTDNAYHQSMSYIIKFALDGTFVCSAESKLGSLDYSNTIVISTNYLFFYIRGVDARNPNFGVLRYDIQNNIITEIYSNSNGYMTLIPKNNGTTEHICCKLNNNSTTSLIIFDVNFNILYSTTDYGILANSRCVIDNNGNIIGGGYEIFDTTTKDYAVFKSKLINANSSLLVDKENNIILGGGIKLQGSGVDSDII